jgi:hypothetical protein
MEVFKAEPKREKARVFFRSLPGKYKSFGSDERFDRIAEGGPTV